MQGKYNKIKYILCEKKRESIGLNLPWVSPIYLETTFALWGLVINFPGNINLVYPPLTVSIKMRTFVFDVCKKKTLWESVMPKRRVRRMQCCGYSLNGIASINSFLIIVYSSPPLITYLDAITRYCLPSSIGSYDGSKHFAHCTVTDCTRDPAACFIS